MPSSTQFNRVLHAMTTSVLRMYPSALRMLTATFLLLFFGTSLSATVYYVDPAGNDSAAGTSPSTAWQTLSKLSATTFNAGDQILLKAGGVWTGQLIPGGSGSAGNPIIINSYGTGNNPRINGPGTNGSATLLLTNQAYWEINNLEITNTQTSGGNAQLTGISIINNGSSMLSHVYVKNCYVHDVNAVGVGNSNYNKGTGGIIYNGYISDVLVQYCHVANVQVEGIRTSSSSNCNQVIFDHNLVENVYGDGIVLHGVQNGSAITHNTLNNVCMSSAANFAGAWTYGSVQTTIAYNEVYGIKGGMNDGEAFDADISTSGDIFEYNYSHDNAGGFMLFMPSASGIIVRYNVSVNDGTGGVKLFNYTSTSTTNQLYNNTFYLGSALSEIFENGFNSTFSNNIFYGAATIGKFSSTAVSSSATFNNNCIFPSSLTTTNGPAGSVNGTIYSNPAFVNAGSDSAGLNAASAYGLQPGSPCRSAGVLISNNGGYDYFNTPLPSGNVDIGAIQHTDTSTTQSTFLPIADSYVRDGSYASTNYGTATTMVVKSDASGYNRNSYIKFAFNGLSDTSIASALLNVYVSSVNTDPTRTITVYGITDTTWQETAITWNNKPIAGTILDSFTVSSQAGTWYQADVTSYTRSHMAGREVSFRLLDADAASSKSDVSFNTREAASGQPTLVITPNGTGGNNVSSSAVLLPDAHSLDVLNNDRSLLVSPNPARETLHIRLGQSGGMIRLFDLNGRVMNEWQVEGNSIDLDVRSFSPGVYIINYVLPGKPAITRQVILQR